MKTFFGILTAGMMLLTSMAFMPRSATAYMGDFDGPPHGRKHIQRMVKELQLTPQQQQQVKDIFVKNRTEIGPLMEQLRTERKTLRAMTHGDTVDEAAIRGQAGRVAAIQADLAVNRARIAQEIRGILTPEQIEKSKELMERHDQRMEQRMSRFHKRHFREL